MNEGQPLHVVLGTGPLGLAVSRRLNTEGRRVRVVNRIGQADLAPHAELMAANVGEAAEARRACQGATVVYHCANPPYAKWPELHPPLMAAIIEGAESSGAKLIFGDNLYAYGPPDGPLTEDLPHKATGPNGRIRARIAEDLLRAHADGRVRAAIGRASDFFGPHAYESAGGSRVFKNALENRPAQVLGNPDLPHTFTYIDDFARALVTLGERDEALGQVWHVPNDKAVTTRQLVGMVFSEAGHPAGLRVAPRWLLTAVGVFNPTLRAVREQLYQFERPWIVDSSKFEMEFGWKATPLSESILATIDWFRKEVTKESNR